MDSPDPTAGNDITGAGVVLLMLALALALTSRNPRRPLRRRTMNDGVAGRS
jgi:hypothetical protein